MPLFIVLEPEYQLDDETRQRIINEIRTNTSPRHVPDEIIEVTAIPHTRTGKKLEIPVKRLIQGAAIESTVNVDAVDDFASLEYFKKFSRDSKKAEGHSF
jgi:acetoacetyl-CoA synthetase